MEKLNFKPGFNVYNRISVKNYRDQIICGAAVIVGNGTNARAHLHSATGISEVLPGTGNLIDRVKLAEELDVDLVLINRGRISTVDEMHYQGGYVANFQGLGDDDLLWLADLLGLHNPDRPDLDAATREED